MNPRSLTINSAEETAMKIAYRLCRLVFVLTAAWSTAQAQNVKVTPLGQRTGEFCGPDRAIVFEDPTGVRILYDPGNTIAGGTDERLGEIHAILISHAHADHLGSARLNQDPNSSPGSCGPAMTTAVSSSITAEIAAAKSSAIIAGGALAGVAGRLTAAVLGSSVGGCATSGLTNETTVPRTTPCIAGLGVGAKRTIRHTSATVGVQVTAVTAEHPNDLSSAFVSDPEKTELSSNGLGGYVGLANGFVVTFTNGLKVYLSGDTGLTSDMRIIVREYYGVRLAVINIGDLFTTGPEEAAFAVNELIRPAAVIPSHVNEAATQGGAVVPGSKTAMFVDLVSRPFGRDSSRTSVFPPLSGLTMEFSNDGRCQTGCRGR
jgi:L-ascorbate metabolism protein UlaG (beta-lactamase superfamily)